MNIPMHRFKYTKLTKEQIDKKLIPTAAGPECVSEYSDALAGKSLKIVTDNGPTLNYTFKDKRKLILAENGGAAVESGYGALTLKQVVFFSHMIPKTQKGYNVFVDLDTNLVTVFEVWLSSGKKEITLGKKEFTIDDREVQRQIYFGYVEIAGQRGAEKAPSSHQQDRRQRHVLETGHRHRDPGIVSFGRLLELCRTDPACGRPQLLQPVGLYTDKRQHVYL